MPSNRGRLVVITELYLPCDECPDTLCHRHLDSNCYETCHHILLRFGVKSADYGPSKLGNYQGKFI